MFRTGVWMDGHILRLNELTDLRQHQTRRWRLVAIALVVAIVNVSFIETSENACRANNARRYLAP